MLTWDAENRPTQIVKAGVTTSFVYDGDGGRVKKTVSRTQGGTTQELTTVYIGKLLVCQGTACAKLIYAGDERVAMEQVNNGSTSYFHQDHLGSTTVLTDGNGAAEEHNSYRPFGALQTHTGKSDVAYKYTGQERDRSTGLAFYLARFYDLLLGRFVSADTIVAHFWDPQELNRYAYARNNPLRYNDPSGHCYNDCGVCGPPPDLPPPDPPQQPQQPQPQQPQPQQPESDGRRIILKKVPVYPKPDLGPSDPSWLDRLLDSLEPPAHGLPVSNQQNPNTLKCIFGTCPALAIRTSHWYDPQTKRGGPIVTIQNNSRTGVQFTLGAGHYLDPRPESYHKPAQFSPDLSVTPRRVDLGPSRRTTIRFGHYPPLSKAGYFQLQGPGWIADVPGWVPYDRITYP